MMIDYSYLTPPNKAKRIKIASSEVYECVNGKHIRKMFACSKYQSFEMQAIDKLRGYLRKKAPNIQYSDELLLKLNYAGHFQLAQAVERLKQYESWHQNEVIINLNKVGRQILQHGHIYSYGRDYEYSPVIIVKPNKFDFKKYPIANYLNATANLLRPIEQYMLIGGLIEKWNVIVDFQGKKINMQPEVVNALKQIADAYPFRLKRLIFINLHTSSQIIVGQIKDLLKVQESQTHVCILKSLEELNQYIGFQERQVKYGGNLLNICQFWPIHTTNKYQQTQCNLSNSEYQSVQNDSKFFEQPKPSFCDMGNSSCHIY